MDRGFDELYMTCPPSGKLQFDVTQAVDDVPPIGETPPSLASVRKAVASLESGKAAGVCNNSAKVLKAKDVAMIQGL